MARKKTKADEIYNARRRYRRAAEKYERKAAKASGIAKSRYQAQAESNLKKALSTYAEGSKPKGKLKTMAESFAIGYQQSGNIGRLVRQSVQTALTNKKNERETMARDILSIDNVGARFYGGLAEIWSGDEDTRKHPNQAIIDFFGAKDIMEVIEKMEQAGIDIYSPTDNETTYMSTQLQIQELVLTRKHATERL